MERWAPGGQQQWAWDLFQASVHQPWWCDRHGRCPVCGTMALGLKLANRLLHRDHYLDALESVPDLIELRRTRSDR
ncbi:hypothetical protein PG988_006592 [Apiospora saccharicola]